MKRFGFMFVLVVLVLSVLLELLSSDAAEAAPIFKSASVNILNKAELATGGVDVTVKYSCAPTGGSTTGFLEVSVSQDPNEGSNEAPATCDNKTHPATVFVAAFFGGTFSPGAAPASAFIANSDDSSFAQQTASITIRG
jgi:hypothetical protein